MLGGVQITSTGCFLWVVYTTSALWTYHKSTTGVENVPQSPNCSSMVLLRSFLVLPLVMSKSQSGFRSSRWSHDLHCLFWEYDSSKRYRGQSSSSFFTTLLLKVGDHGITHHFSLTLPVSCCCRTIRQIGWIRDRPPRTSIPP